MLRISTDKIGPILQSATRPKLSSPECLSLRIDAMPAPRAMMNGTVIGPVVTPPESKAVGIKCEGAKIARIPARIYKMRSIFERGIPFLVLIMESAKNIPTPIATDKMRTMLGIDGTCSARTCKSGSAMVINAPKIKQTTSGIIIFLHLLICIPIPSPKGCIDISEPIVKRLIPANKRRVPKINRTRIPVSNGEIEMLSKITIAAIGRTEEMDSLIAPFKSFTQSLL